MTFTDLRLAIYSDTSFKKNIAYDVNNNPEYIGLAAPGTSDSVSGWQIKKITYDVNENPTDIDFANSSADFNKIWSSRTSYSYG